MTGRAVLRVALGTRPWEEFLASAALVVAARCDADRIIAELVDEAMFVGDPAGPVSGEVVLECLGSRLRPGHD